MFPKTEDFSYLISNIENLLKISKDQSELSSLVKFLNEKKDILVRKMKAFKLFEENTNFDSIIKKLWFIYII